MALNTLKRAENSELFLKMFHLKGPTFGRLTINLFLVISEQMYGEFMQKWEQKYSLNKI